MSKFPSHILLPAFGGLALVLAAALVFSNRDYGQSKIEMLETRIDQVKVHEAAAREKARMETERAEELKRKIAEVQAASAERRAGGMSPAALAPNPNGAYGIGRKAHPEEIAAWDVDVLPDGRGLPEGSGDVFTGEEVFADKCASCHGDFAEGVDNWPVLAGGFDTIADEDPVKTVGSYWPYLSTVWDYVNRSMPFGSAQTLTADETYAIVAYILYSNDLVDDEFELSHENFSEFDMYNKDGFVIDDRPAVEYEQWRKDPCMENCKESVEITMRATVLDVTPGDENDGSAHGAMEITAVKETTTEEPAVGSQSLNPELVMAGEKVFKKCKACHQVGEGAKNKVGPHLNGIMGRAFASEDGFKYSKVFMAAAEEGRVWDEDSMTEFLTKPKAYMKGTKMTFVGLKKNSDVSAILEYLKSIGE